MATMGMQFIASHGYRQLEAGSVYHFLRSDPKSQLVSLVRFLPYRPTDREVGARATTLALSQAVPNSGHVDGKPKTRTQPVAHLVRMDRFDFEEGLQTMQIQRKPVQDALPAWLCGLEETRLGFSDERRKSCNFSHVDRIDRRLAHIHEMVQRFDEVLASTDPEGVLNRAARACAPKVNETRFRLWFFSYLAFGKKRFALHYSTAGIGRWDRLSEPYPTKRGAPSIVRGRGFGYNATLPMVEQILKSYRKRSGLGQCRRDIYRRAIVEDFGCRPRRGARGYQEFFQPEGRPFPTVRIFWYHVDKAIGKVDERRTRVGGVRERTDNTPYRGAFSADVCNLMEKVEWDAYVMKETPRGLLDRSEMKSWRVVRARDVRSGMFTGIGFSLGSETGSAYRMARFFQAVDKVWCCGLFGIIITKEQWPSQGCSPSDIQDRGPGATPGAFSNDPAFDPVIKEIPPAWSGQSKALIEGSHPKSANHLEGPSFIRSDKNPFQLVIQEIYRLLADIDTMDVGDRIPSDLLDVVERPTPLCLWNALDELARNDALPMSRDEAIRSYLTRVPAVADRRGISLMGRVYGSKALDASGYRERISGHQTIAVQVFVLEACVRHIWLEVQGQIVQLDMQLPYRAGDEELYITLGELRDRAAHLQESRRSMPDHRLASRAERASEFKRSTGRDWASGTRVKGRAKTGTKIAKREAAEVRGVIEGRKR